jgi:hypothetical protein
MVAAVHERTPGGALPLFARALPLLQTEWSFWTQGAHSLLVRTPNRDGRVHRLSRYLRPRIQPKKRIHVMRQGTAPSPPYAARTTTCSDETRGAGVDDWAV